MRYRRWKREARRVERRYQQLCARPIDVRCFLVPRDGTDTQPAIQEAIAFAERTNTGGIYMGPGVYPVENPIRLGSSKGSVIYGAEITPVHGKDQVGKENYKELGA